MNHHTNLVPSCTWRGGTKLVGTAKEELVPIVEPTLSVFDVLKRFRASTNN
jgi:hypothetical protein